ncbi:uncharacterized protein LOC106674333 [Cimex lectularius]|uniref:Uncharacterized protein n=1 Tax=Cimex lectularius TaxID=79782 RepID=A0A8I6SDP2_CIMLE|nr:uncharacterized protein LOC106674333 [Cimex lectularius]
MKFLAVVTCLVAVAFGRSFEGNAKTLTFHDPPDVVISGKGLVNPQMLWDLFKGLIPSDYFNLIEKQELYQNKDFQKDVFNLALKQLSMEVHTQIAKQNKLREFVQCSCPTSTCGNIPVEVDDFRTELNPYFQEVKSTIEMETALKTLRLMKFSMDQIQRRYQQVVVTVDCSCPKAEQCRSTLPPHMYDIISGKNDDSLRNAYWQGALHKSPLFPNIMPQELYNSLQAAWMELLETYFANVVPPSWGWSGQAPSHNRTEASTDSKFVSTYDDAVVDDDEEVDLPEMLTESVNTRHSDTDGLLKTEKNTRAKPGSADLNRSSHESVLKNVTPVSTGDA